MRSTRGGEKKIEGDERRRRQTQDNRGKRRVLRETKKIPDDKNKITQHTELKKPGEERTWSKREGV